MYRNYGSCVKLPNGLIVAYESYINFAHNDYKPEAVVKEAGGKVLSRGDNDGPFYFSETTAWWTDCHPLQNGDRACVGLAYRPDIGLVNGDKDPDLYTKLKREAGELLEEGKMLRNTNILGVLNFLIHAPEYYSGDCDIPFFSFTESYKRESVK